VRSPAAKPSLGEIAREWGRIGCIGFGGALSAATVAFLPSFSFVMLGARHSTGCAATTPCSSSSTVPAAAAFALLVARGSVVMVLLAAGAIGALAAQFARRLPLRLF
jgi:chromate transport protein ChrA